jgi:hypothetical protein
VNKETAKHWHKIYQNKNLSGRLNNIGFGLCSVIDGLIRVLSLGYLHTTLTLDYARNTAKNRFVKLKRERGAI